MTKNAWLLSMLIASFTGIVCADDKSNHAIMDRLKELAMPQAEIQPSPISGLNTVIAENRVLYMTADGKYLLQGPLYELSGSVPVNLTNQLLNEKLQAISDEMIIYKAPKEKHVITVFTDITCGYCRKLHQQMQEYNSLGITVRYLAFPREGLSSQAEKDMRSIWCTADRNKSLDAAMKGDAISPASCKTNISKHYQLGLLFGIQGTPVMILKNGTVIPGYEAPKELEKILDTHQTSLKTAG